MTVEEIRRILAEAVFIELYQANLMRTSAGMTPSARSLSDSIAGQAINELVRTGVLVVND